MGGRPGRKRGAIGQVVIPCLPFCEVPMAHPLDRSTVEALYRRYGDPVERCCLRVLRDETEAADAAHEVFLKLLTKGDDFRADANWMTWLYSVANNLCINRLRNEKNRRRLLELNSDAIQSSSMCESSLIEDRNVLRMLFDSEDAKTQEIVICRYIHGMTLQETADMVGLSRPTVSRRLKDCEERAKAMLKPKENP